MPPVRAVLPYPVLLLSLLLLTPLLPGCATMETVTHAPLEQNRTMIVLARHTRDSYSVKAKMQSRLLARGYNVVDEVSKKNEKRALLLTLNSSAYRNRTYGVVFSSFTATLAEYNTKKVIMHFEKNGEMTEADLMRTFMEAFTQHVPPSSGASAAPSTQASGAGDTE